MYVMSVSRSWYGAEGANCGFFAFAALIACFFVIFGPFMSKILHILTTFLRLTGRPISYDAVRASIRVPYVGLSEDMRVTAFATAASMPLSTGLFS